MSQSAIYLDYQATTPLDARVLAAMRPWLCENFGNAGSTSHVFGRHAKGAVDEAREKIAAGIGAAPREIVFTSGATESNNLALKGFAERNRKRGNHLVSVTTEHRAVLDPLARLARQGFEVTLLPVVAQSEPDAGRIGVDQLTAALRPETTLVSIMLVNNEVGVVQPLAEIAAACHARGVFVHCDATQAVGKMPLDVAALDIDLMSFSAHKIYGPKGVGALYVRKRIPQPRLEAQMDGGGQEGGLRSGTLNVPGIVGFAAALELCLGEMETERLRLAQLRNLLAKKILEGVSAVSVNGPSLAAADLRLPGNLNLCFANVDGEALLMNMGNVAVSSGAACTSSNPEPSHVLRALGLSDDLARASLRFGLGRFTTLEEIDSAARSVCQTVMRLRQLATASP